MLLPVFAIGRAQELLLLLDDYWTRNPELQAGPARRAACSRAGGMLPCVGGSVDKRAHRLDTGPERRLVKLVKYWSNDQILARYRAQAETGQILVK